MGWAQGGKPPISPMFSVALGLEILRVPNGFWKFWAPEAWTFLRAGCPNPASGHKNSRLDLGTLPFGIFRAQPKSIGRRHSENLWAQGKGRQGSPPQSSGGLKTPLGWKPLCPDCATGKVRFSPHTFLSLRAEISGVRWEVAPWQSPGPRQGGLRGKSGLKPPISPIFSFAVGLIRKVPPLNGFCEFWTPEAWTFLRAGCPNPASGKPKVGFGDLAFWNF